MFISNSESQATELSNVQDGALQVEKSSEELKLFTLIRYLLEQIKTYIYMYLYLYRYKETNAYMRDLDRYRYTHVASKAIW